MRKGCQSWNKWTVLSLLTICWLWLISLVNLKIHVTISFYSVSLSNISPLLNLIKLGGKTPKFLLLSNKKGETIEGTALCMVLLDLASQKTIHVLLLTISFLPGKILLLNLWKRSQRKYQGVWLVIWLLQ